MCRTAIEVAEDYADGRATREALRQVFVTASATVEVAWRDASLIERDGLTYFAGKRDALACSAASVAQAVTSGTFNGVRVRAALDAIGAARAHAAIPDDLWGSAAGDDAALRAAEAERPKQVHVLRDIFGNPSRVRAAAPAWSTWNNGVAAKLTQTIYENRELPSGILDRTRLAVLADAMEEAACVNVDVLDHLRQPDGVHVRGCWVVDLLLRKA